MVVEISKISGFRGIAKIMFRLVVCLRDIADTLPDVVLCVKGGFSIFEVIISIGNHMDESAIWEKIAWQQ